MQKRLKSCIEAAIHCSRKRWWAVDEGQTVSELVDLQDTQGVLDKGDIREPTEGNGKPCRWRQVVCVAAASPSDSVTTTSSSSQTISNSFHVAHLFGD
jgi:hypothetical protein